MESKKRGNILSVVLYNIIFILLSIFAVNVAYAYFTATASKGGDVSFASLSLNILNESDGNLSNDGFTSYLDQDLLPGDTITFDNIKVENASNVSSYALVNLNIDVIPTDTTKATLTYNKWYNLSGQEVDTNFVNTDATLMASNEDKTLDIDFTFPGEDITNAYKNAKTRVTLGAYGTQENLRDSQAYVSKTKYASYHIIKNANRIQEQNPGKNLLDIDAMLNSQLIDNFDGTYSLLKRGTSRFSNYFDINIPANTEFTISYDRLSYDGTHNLEMNFTCTMSDGSIKYIGFYSTPTVKTIKYDLDLVKLRLYIQSDNPETTTLTFKNLMIELGNTRTDYEPYSTIDFAYGKNLFDATKIKSTSIKVSSNGQQITMPIITLSTSNGYTVTGSTLKELCPNLKVGDVATLSFKTTSNYSKYIHLYGEGKTWNVNQQYKITQASLDSTVVLYGNSVASGETEQVTISNLQIELGSTATSYWTYGDLVDPLRKVGVGKNLFSGWKIGEINVSSGNETGGTSIISDFIEINPTETYTISIQEAEDYAVVIAPRFYNAKMEYIGHNAWQINAGSKSIKISDTKLQPLTDYTTNIPTDMVPAYVRFRVIASNKFVTQQDYQNNLLQLEKGSTATAYEAYTGVEDTYDETTKTITRNVGIFEMKSSLTYSTKTNTDPNYTSFWISQYSNMTDCETNSIKTIFYCTHFPYRYSNITYVNRTDEGIMGYGDSSAAFMLTVESSLASTLEEFQGYLAEQETLGDPVFLYYPKMSGTTQVVG